MKEKAILNNNTLSGCGAEPCCASQFKKLVAFSLAEVLITMGIIGVVAAITIPSLVSSIKKQETETKLVKFYSSINQAIKLAEIKYGDKIDWSKPTFNVSDNINWVNTYLKPYMNIVKVEASGIYAMVTLTDGSIFGVSGDAWKFFPQECTNCRDGIDYYHFHFLPNYYIDSLGKYHYNKGVETFKYAWDGTREDLFDDGERGCKNGSLGRVFCTALIQMNGWKIPSDYPFKY